MIYRMNSSITSLSPTPRNGKHGWYDQFQKHNLLLNNSKAKMLIVGDSLVSNLSRYPEIWRKHFINHGAFNFVIAGDKAQNVLWRVDDFYFSSNLNLKYIFILCGTNSIDHNSPQSIANTIVSTGLTFQKKSHRFQVVISSLLPPDDKYSLMLWFKNPVLILTHLSLVLSQIQLHKVLCVGQNSQTLRFLLLLNLPSQFLQPIAIIFHFRFLQSLNLMIQNLFVGLLKHLIFRLFL